MRGLILILILLVVAAIAAIATGFLNIDQIRGAQAPAVSITDNGVVAKGGQAPAFDVDTGKVAVQPPRIEVTPSQPEGGTQQPQPQQPQQARPQPQPQQPRNGQQQPQGTATTDSTQR
jgi:DNA-binding transcriptional regulator of glucitol operon